MSNRPRRRWWQFTLRGLLALTTLIALGLGYFWQFRPWWQEEAAIARLREEFISAKDSRAAGRAFEALLLGQKRSRLERLARDENPSIALKASFELLADRTDGYAKLSAKAQNKFLRDVEQHTGLTPPDWWVKSLQDMFPGRGRETFGYADLVHDEESVILTADGRQLVLSADHVDELGHHSIFGDHFSLSVHSPHSYLAVFDDVGFGYSLYCLDSATGYQVWQARVWAAGVDNLGGITGQWSHGAKIEVHGDRVVVWGAGTGGSYAEVFDAATGECQLRFCAEYWYSHTSP